MLFHEIYSSYYNAVAAILGKALSEKMDKKRINALVRQYAFEESSLTIPEKLLGGDWCLMTENGQTPLLAPPQMPLTTLQRRWLKALLLDARIGLFDPDPTGLEEVEPLFTPEELVCYDRSVPGDPYTDPGYRERFRLLLAALEQGQWVEVTYRSAAGQESVLTGTPKNMEYSPKDNRFRLLLDTCRGTRTLALSRVLACGVTEPSPKGARVREPQPRPTVTFLLKDERNALERVLLHFSHLEKETKQLDKSLYRVTLTYDAEDETELLIRLLSFGPVVRVVAPDTFAARMRERLRRQAVLFAEDFPGNSAGAVVQ